MTVIYVYGIAPFANLPASGVSAPAGIHGSPVVILPLGATLAAVAGRLEQTSIAGEALLDPVAAAEAALAHHSVLEWAHSQSAIIPLAFGSAFGTMLELQSQIGGAREPEWVALLSRLEGCEEVEVRLSIDEDRLRESLLAKRIAAQLESMPVESMPAESMPAESMPAESMPAESMPAESMPAESMPAESMPAQSKTAQSKTAQSKTAESMTAGRRYLLERAVNRDLPELLNTATREAWSRWEKAFAQASSRGLLTEVRGAAIRPNEARVYLQERSSQALANLAEELSEMELGIHFEIPHPWPPYSFAAAMPATQNQDGQGAASAVTAKSQGFASLGSDWATG